MINQLLLALGSAEPVALPVTTLAEDTELDVTASASFSLNSSGNWSASGNTVSNSGTWLQYWSASDFEARVQTSSVTGDGLSSGTLDTWLNLGTTRSWARTCTIAQLTRSTTFTVEIRHASSGIIYATCDVSLYANAEPSG